MPPILRKLRLFAAIVGNTLPIVAMIALIPVVSDDLLLTGIYILFTLVALALTQDKKDLVFLAFGFVTLTASEYLFVSTGVERFERTSLFGVMPLWLPFLWAYVFVAIRRMVSALDGYLPRE